MYKIDIRDLRVGNWVRITEPDNLAGATVRIYSLSSQEGAYFTVTVDDSEFGYYIREVFCEDIEPIPITEEILEKNGFVRFGTSYMLEKEGFLLSNPSSPSQYHDNYFIKIGIKSVNIKYIHQLQNILRVLDIDKEIAI